jgi:predicted O-methyltransferase YrrM
MANRIKNTFEWLRFYMKAANSKGHGTHSPFVYHFITEILNDTRNFYAFKEIEDLKKKLTSNQRRFIYNGKKTTIASLLDTSLPTKYNQLLFRMVDFYKPSSILEIGGSFGITTAYLASPNKKTSIHLIENNETFTSFTRNILKELTLDNATPISKEQLFEQGNKYGLILINQSNWESEELTKDLSAFVEEESVIILTGINKSLDKKKHWEKIVDQSMKTFSIKLFGVGIIFFRKDLLKKQHFAIRF